MPKCELKILSKCSPCLPKQKQKNTKKLGIGKTHTLENQHSIDLLTSKHSITQKIAPQTSSRHHQTLGILKIQME
jgi:hypothetical protein